MDYLRTAKNLGSATESFHVAVAPDTYIREVKGREPRWAEDQRSRTVLAVRGVDTVSIETASQAIRMHKPRLFVKGIEWAGGLPPDVVQACRNAGTTIAFVDTPGKHTSEASGVGAGEEISAVPAREKAKKAGRTGRCLTDGVCYCNPQRHWLGGEEYH